MSIRTCPTCGTDVDVSNGLLGCPVCGASLAAARPGRDEVPTSILQFFDDVEPEARPSFPEPGPDDRSRGVASPSGTAAQPRLAAEAGRAGAPRAADDTRELPRVPADPPVDPPVGPPAGPGAGAVPGRPAAPAAASSAASTAPSTGGALLFDDLTGPGAPGRVGAHGLAADARRDGSGRRRDRAAGRWPGGLLLIAAFALGGLAVVAAFALRGGSTPTSRAAAPAPARTSAPTASSPAATPTPSETADAPADPAAVAHGIEGLLVRSDEARGTLNSATGPLGTCRIDPAGAASTIQSVVDERQRILADLQGLSAAQVAALPSGDQLVGALASAMQASIAADQAYVQWADDAQGCTPGEAPPTQALREGNQLSRSAQSAKSIFVTLWNPIAERYGLPTRTANDV